MQDVYTIRELAAVMGVSWQRIATWKKTKTIPEKAFTSDGKIIKKAVEHFIETHKKEPTAKTTTRKRRSKRPNLQKRGLRISTEKPNDGFNDFARKYWEKNARAVDVLFSNKENKLDSFNKINEVLEYAYKELNK